MKLNHFLLPALIATTPLLWLPSCNKKETSATAENTTPAAEHKSAEQIAAEKIVREHPNIELVECKDGKAHIQNVYTKLGLILSYQDIIDKKFDSIAGGEAEAAQILPPHKTGILQAAKGHDDHDWGKTPEWMPRLENAKVQPNAQHFPRRDGSVWGQLSFTHPDSIQTLRDLLVDAYARQDMIIDLEMPGEDKLTLIFTTPFDKNKPQPEKELRRVVHNITRQGNTTTVIIQYTYGMKPAQ